MHHPFISLVVFILPLCAELLAPTGVGCKAGGSQSLRGIVHVHASCALHCGSDGAPNATDGCTPDVASNLRAHHVHRCQYWPVLVLRRRGIHDVFVLLHPGRRRRRAAVLLHGVPARLGRPTGTTPIPVLMRMDRGNRNANAGQMVSRSSLIMAAERHGVAVVRLAQEDGSWNFDNNDATTATARVARHAVLAGRVQAPCEPVRMLR